MNSLSLAAFPSPIKPQQRTARTLLKALLLVGTLLSGGLAVQPANALAIVTTGTIISGSETGGLFGLPTATTSLVGNLYTLVVTYSGLGPNYFTTGNGSFAQDTENAPGTTGFVTATINGRSLSTPLTNSLGSSLIEDMFDFAASNQGFNGSSTTGAFVNVLQDLSCNDVCIPVADLKTPFRFVLGSFDFGTDLFTFQGAGFPAAGTPIANFTGSQTSFALVPEPASWVLLAGGLLGLCLRARRPRA